MDLELAVQMEYLLKKINIMMPINIMRLVMFDFFKNRTKFKYFNRTSTLNFVFMINISV